jgi:hypothetical protein
MVKPCGQMYNIINDKIKKKGQFLTVWLKIAPQKKYLFDFNAID